MWQPKALAASANGSLAVAILAEREEGALTAILTIKNEEDGQKITVQLVRVQLGVDEDGEEVSTLVVQSVQSGAVEGAKAPPRKSIPRNIQMLISVVQQAIAESERPPIRPFADGPLVKAVPDSIIRHRYYLRLAEEADPDEDQDKLAERRKAAFRRAIDGAGEEQAAMLSIIQKAALTTTIRSTPPLAPCASRPWRPRKCHGRRRLSRNARAPLVFSASRLSLTSFATGQAIRWRRLAKNIGLAVTICRNSDGR